MELGERVRGKVLVTGATGFVGSAIVEACERQGIDVRASARDPGGSARFREYVAADVEEPTTLQSALKGVDAVIHCAGLAHRFDGGGKRAAFIRTNAEGTANLVEAALRAGVCRVVLVSSVAVYGAGSPGIQDETTPCRPVVPYATSKYAAEQEALRVLAPQRGHLTILRMATVYGEGDPGNVGRLVRAIDRGRFVWIGSGHNRKSLIHRDDAARACLAALALPGCGADVFNVSGPSYAMREIVSEIGSLLGRRVPSWCIPDALAVGAARLAVRVTGGRGRAGELAATLGKWLSEDVYDTRKFEDATRFRPQVELADGLRRQVAWYRRQTR